MANTPMIARCLDAIAGLTTSRQHLELQTGFDAGRACDPHVLLTS